MMPATSSSKMLGSFSRLSLLWKILLATSIALTLLFALVGWIVQDNATRAMSASVDEDVQASFRAYDSLWRSRAQTLAAVSLVISRMSDVRAAFSTGDQATIRDSANELWQQISNQDAIFLVTDPEGRVLASLGGSLGESLKHDVPAVRDAAASFPKQTSGFVTSRRPPVPDRRHAGVRAGRRRDGIVERTGGGLRGESGNRAQPEGIHRRQRFLFSFGSIGGRLHA